MNENYEIQRKNHIQGPINNSQTLQNQIRYTEDIWFLQCKIKFYFTEWTPKAVFSWVAYTRGKIPLLLFVSEIKFDLTLKKKKKFCSLYAFIYNNYAFNYSSTPMSET